MNDRSRIAVTMLAGAVIGGLAGFLMFTDRGRRLRAELKPHLDELAREVRSLQEMALHVRQTATDSWRQVEDFVGDLGEPGAPGVGESRH